VAKIVISMLECTVGCDVGANDGSTDGLAVGILVGCIVGANDGTTDGLQVGMLVGIAGARDGCAVGDDEVGTPDGWLDIVGSNVGFLVDVG